jgi:transcriptional regulator with XRE-family HTH domain
MTDPEDPAAKNEQELNLFSDQPQPEDAPAETESGASAPAVSGAFPADSGMLAQDSEQPRAIAEPERDASPSDGPDDAAVVAPPPSPRKQPAFPRPGVVVPPHPGRGSFPPSAASAASADQNHKPLPHTVRPDQTLGQMLSAIRNARGMTLEEVALATRIRMEYLTELEADNLLKTLPPVYISAYVRKLIEVYDLSREDSKILLDTMHGETPQNPEELPEKLIESVNEGVLVNEGENKRIRNITIIFFTVIGLVAAAIIWLVVLVVVHYVRTSDPVPGRDPGAVQPAAEPVSQTIHMDESDLDALVVPETPSISVLKMSKAPGVRDSL